MGLALLLATEACVAATAKPSDLTMWGRLMPTNRTLGFTYCGRDGVPATWINVKILGTEDARAIAMHELKHAEQIRRFNSCGAWEEHLKLHRAEVEAEAFCENMKIDMAPPKSLPRILALAKYAAWLSDGYPFLRLTPMDAMRLLVKYC